MGLFQTRANAKYNMFMFCSLFGIFIYLLYSANYVDVDSPNTEWQ